ncbi:unnamed protein product, partial [Polarella glacialis]
AAHWSVRAAAAKAFGRLHAQGVTSCHSDRDAPGVEAAAAARLAALLQDDVPDVAEAAAAALGSLSIHGARLASQLAACLENEDLELRVAASESLHRLFLAPAKDVREAAAAGIGVFFARGGWAPSEEVEQLVHALATLTQDEDRHVREEVAKTLGSIGSCSSVVSRKWNRLLSFILTSLLALVQEDLAPSVQRAAVEALGRMDLQKE